jgi:hypothetical protein
MEPSILDCNMLPLACTLIVADGSYCMELWDGLAPLKSSVCSIQSLTSILKFTANNPSPPAQSSHPGCIAPTVDSPHCISQRL